LELATGMTAGLSGWTTCSVLVTRLRYVTVFTRAGVFTIVNKEKTTCLYIAAYRLYTTVTVMIQMRI